MKDLREGAKLFKAKYGSNVPLFQLYEEDGEWHEEWQIRHPRFLRHCAFYWDSKWMENENFPDGGPQGGE
jgi:hypothetical protein